MADTPFSRIYKERIFKEPAEARLIQLGFLINEVIGRMAMTNSPTEWNNLLQERENLEIEHENLAAFISSNPHNG